MAAEKSELIWNASCGALRGLKTEQCRKFLNVPFAKAERFGYAEPIKPWDGVRDATAFGPGCPQNRTWHPHPEHPTRRFYQREFRDRRTFQYDEDCLNLNIYVPHRAENAPVILFFYGGGFDSGLNAESPFDGDALAAHGAIAVVSNYRVGVLGYLTHEAVKARYGREGNFGLDDQLTALKWVRRHIASFGGDPDNITLMGQSAGAISIQYLCLNPAHAGLFRRAVMLSGAGQFPKFALPKAAEKTRAYWAQFIETAGVDGFEGLKNASLDTLFDTVEKMKDLRSDALFYTMPVVDGVLLPDSVDRLMPHPLPVDYLIGYTNCDMYAPILARIGNRFGRHNNAYLYYFDLNAPGDDNRAFHSADIRYVFGTLGTSWRPYGKRDYEASEQLLSYLTNFARTGDPNGDGLPRWERSSGGLRTNVLHIAPTETKMGHAHYGTMLRNFLTKGDPKA
ncbi:MAG: carboxylesterase family protein [Clostridia bacterium]|nr:carboxylesterase family protein [Clostridia bacterium]